VLPFPAGGGLDVIARLMAEAIRTSLGQPIIVENVSGASGSIGVGRAVRAAPDGHTLVMGQWGTHVINGAIYTLSYDVLNDFAPILRLTTAPLFISGRKSLPANDLKSLIAWLKANPDKATAATGGVGAVGHVAGLLFQKETGTRIQFVPYRGGGPAMQDLVAGQVDMTIATSADSLEQIRAGSIKTFAVAARNRAFSAPDVPTVDEAGASGLYVANWVGMWAPKNTPKDIITRINAVAVTAMNSETVRRRLTEIGQDILPREQQTPESLAAFQRSEIERWWPIIKAANIKGE
jgi:tripartite-type tricarboxylate transporter receptor subunit TctC